MKMRVEPLPEAQWTSMIDIIFQLMIFFLVTLSVMPAIKSAPQVEGIMNLPTPKRGDSEASMLIQLHETPQKAVDYYVLQGDDPSAEFYTWFQDKRAVVNVPAAYIAFRNAVVRYNVLYNQNSLTALLEQVWVNDPAVIIRAPGNIPYSEVVRITGEMHSLGITKIAWLRGELKDLQVEIKRGRTRGSA